MLYKPEVDAAGAFVRLAVEMAALDVIERRRAEGPRRVGRILAATDNVDVGRVVRAGGRRDRAVVEEPALHGQHLAGAGGHEHDIDELLLDDLP